MNTTAYKTKLGDIVSGGVLDNLKSMNNSFSSYEESMFDNNLIVHSEDNQASVNISNEFAREDDYIRSYKIDKKSSSLYTNVFISSLVAMLGGDFWFHYHYSVSLLVLIIVSVLFIPAIAFLVALVLPLHYGEYKAFAEEKNKIYLEEINKERSNVMGGFKNPRVVGKFDNLLFVLDKIYTSKEFLYREDDFHPDTFKELLKYNILKRVVFEGKDSWVPENKDVMESVIKYNYSRPKYAVTNNAINVFIEDEATTREIFKAVENNKDCVIPPSMFDANPSMKHIVNVLALMNVLTQREADFIQGHVINFGSRYKDYLAYMENK